MKQANKTKILKLLAKLLADYKKTNTTVIQEFPTEDEKKELAKLDAEVEKYKKDFKALLKVEKKKMFFLFMNHKSGEHGLSAHATIKELKAEVQSVVDLIKDDATEAQYNDDCNIVEEITGDGDFYELSDTTWFDVFEVEV